MRMMMTEVETAPNVFKKGKKMLKMHIDQTPAAIDLAQKKWHLSVPNGYDAIGVATQVGYTIPEGLVVKNKLTGICMLAVGGSLRGFDERLLSKQPTLDTIVVTAAAGTKARWVHQSQREGIKLSDWIIKRVEAP